MLGRFTMLFKELTNFNASILGIFPKVDDRSGRFNLLKLLRLLIKLGKFTLGMLFNKSPRLGRLRFAIPVSLISKFGMLRLTIFWSVGILISGICGMLPIPQIPDIVINDIYINFFIIFTFIFYNNCCIRSLSFFLSSVICCVMPVFHASFFF